MNVAQSSPCNISCQNPFKMTDSHTDRHSGIYSAPMLAPSIMLLKLIKNSYRNDAGSPVHTLMCIVLLVYQTLNCLLMRKLTFSFTTNWHLFRSLSTKIGRIASPRNRSYLASPKSANRAHRDLNLASQLTYL